MIYVGIHDSGNRKIPYSIFLVMSASLQLERLQIKLFGEAGILVVFSYTYIGVFDDTNLGMYQRIGECTQPGPTMSTLSSQMKGK